MSPASKNFLLILLFVLPFSFFSSSAQTHAQETFPLTGSCEPSSPEVFVDEEVAWTVDVDGGTGVYSYSWSGDEDLSGSAFSIRKRYDRGGIKTAEVVVRSGAREITIQCEQAVVVRVPTLRGSCSANVVIRGNEKTITWSTNAQGGVGSYSYAWQGSSGLAGFSSSVRKTYPIPGFEFATVVIKSGTDRITLTCNANIPEVQASSTEPVRTASCQVVSPRYITGESLRFDAGATPRTTTFRWSGFEGVNADSETVQTTYQTPGVKSATVVISGSSFNTHLTCQALVAERDTVSTRGSGLFGDSCFIATAAFGTPMEKEVVVLREFRDDVLLQSSLGEKIVKIYYEMSPPLASIIEKNGALRSVTRILLRPLIAAAKLL